MTAMVIPFQRPAVPAIHIRDELDRFLHLRAEFAGIGLDLDRLANGTYLIHALFGPLVLIDLHQVQIFAAELGIE